MLTSKPKLGHTRRDEGGYALFAVTMFVFVVIIGSVAIFSTTSSETMLTHHDLEKSQAFYLADAAIERARARLSHDADWRDGWNNITLGDGTYSLTISDTTVMSYQGVKIVATGTVNAVTRRLEVIGQIPSTVQEFVAYSGENLEANGNIHADPGIHVVGSAWFAGGGGLAGGELTTGPYPLAPVMHTEPGDWPGATHYRVVPSLSGSTPTATVLDRNGNDITSSLTMNPADVMSYDSGTQTFSYDFTGNGDLDDWLDYSSGVFARQNGDASVVVDFGLPSPSPPGYQARSDVHIAGSGGNGRMRTTVVNTRFIGSGDAQRRDTQYWMGGEITYSHIKLIPDNGVATVSHNITVADESVFLGTSQTSALVFATGDFEAMQNTSHMYGALVALGDIHLAGSHHFRFDSEFLANIPNFLIETWPGFGGVMLNIVSWRDISSPGA